MYFADDGDSSTRERPTRPTDERGYVVRRNVSDPATRPDYAIPLGTVGGVWQMIKQVARWKPEGWLGLWKGMWTYVIFTALCQISLSCRSINIGHTRISDFLPSACHPYHLILIL